MRALDIRNNDACRGITPHGLDATLRGVDRSALELRLPEELCHICCNERRAMHFFTCGHKYCADCGAQMRRCPSCMERPRRKPLPVFLF
jgi:hypothetical protein